jgi:hypothetical protein
VLLNTTAQGATIPSFASQATFAVGTSLFAVAVGDFNGDFNPGFQLDLAVANKGAGTVSVLLQTPEQITLTNPEAIGTLLGNFVRPSSPPSVPSIPNGSVPPLTVLSAPLNTGANPDIPVVFLFEFRTGKQTSFLLWNPSQSSITGLLMLVLASGRTTVLDLFLAPGSFVQLPVSLTGFVPPGQAQATRPRHGNSVPLLVDGVIEWLPAPKKGFTAVFVAGL